MTQSEVLAAIEKVQSGFDISALKYRNKNVWPVLRYYMAYVLMKSGSGEKKESAGFSQTINTNHQTNPPANNKLLSLLKFPSQAYQYRTQQKRFAAAVKEIMFLLPANEPYPDVVAEKKYSRYLDPYLQAFLKYQPVTKVQLTNGDIKSDEYAVPFIALNERGLTERIRTASKLVSRLKRDGGDKAGFYETLNSLNKFADERNIPYYFQSWLSDDLDTVNVYETLFFDFLKDTNVRTVFLECYYSLCLFGLVSACRRLNITVVDIQHGVVDINYLGWQNLPGSVANYLPHYYWVWSSNDYKQVNLSNNPSLLKPVLGGNLWLKRFKDLNPSENGHLSKDQKKGVLISLQMGAVLSQTWPLIMEVVKREQQKIQWMLRFHPLNSQHEKEEIVKALSGFENVEYEKASRENLYSVFQNTHVHLVASSAVALEGLQFNLPTVIIHSLGKDLFKSLIETSVFCYADTAETILKQINEFVPSQHAAEYKIETSEALACEALTLVTQKRVLAA